MSYQSKAVTSKISATSKVTLKIRDNFYSVEASEERTIPDVEGVDLDMEWNALWDSLNEVVDKQAEDIVKTFK